MTTNQLKFELLLVLLETDKQQIAKRLKLSRATVSKTIAGTRGSQETKEKIKEVLCNDVRELVEKIEPAPT